MNKYLSLDDLEIGDHELFAHSIVPKQVCMRSCITVKKSLKCSFSDLTNIPRIVSEMILASWMQFALPNYSLIPK